jgi:hypothetical protein
MDKPSRCSDTAYLEEVVPAKGDHILTTYGFILQLHK